MIQWAQVSALYAGILALIMLACSVAVVRLRRIGKVGLGDGDNPELARAIRAHANFAEYVPLTLLLIALFEMNGGAVFFVHLLGASLVVARALHAWGLYHGAGTSFGRFYGTLVTWLVLATSALLNISLALS